MSVSILPFVCLLGTLFCMSIDFCESFGLQNLRNIQDLEDDILLDHEIERRAQYNTLYNRDTTCRGFDFEFVSGHPLKNNYADKTWFGFDAYKNCQWYCLEEKFPWGDCLGWSMDHKWWGGQCYLFDHHISRDEDLDVKDHGETRNRICL